MTVALAACSAEEDVDPSTEALTGSATNLRGAAASESAAAASQPVQYPSDEDPGRYTLDNGGYAFTLPDGGICSVGADLNDKVGSDFACLLTLEDPMQTEDGESTTGLEYQDNMFSPSTGLADRELQEEFTDLDAEPLGPQSNLTVGGYEIIVETNDEYGFAGKAGGNFFVAVQHVTRFWDPRPDWVPEPNFPPIN